MTTYRGDGAWPPDYFTAQRQDVAALLRNMADEFNAGAHDWENDSLSAFLDAMSRFLGDLDGYFDNNPTVPRDLSWYVLGRALSAARFYE